MTHVTDEDKQLNDQQNRKRAFSIPSVNDMRSLAKFFNHTAVGVKVGVTLEITPNYYLTSKSEPLPITAAVQTESGVVAFNDIDGLTSSRQRTSSLPSNAGSSLAASRSSSSASRPSASPPTKCQRSNSKDSSEEEAVISTTIPPQKTASEMSLQVMQQKQHNNVRRTVHFGYQIA